MQTDPARVWAARLDSRWALPACLGYVFLVVLTPLGYWKLIGAESLVLFFTLGLLGINIGQLIRRLLGFLPLLVLLGVLVALSHPGRGVAGVSGIAVAIVCRNSLALAAVLTLGLLYSSTELILCLRRLGCPPVIVSTLHFMDRYAHVLGEERNRMLIARSARTFGLRRSSTAAWLDLGHLLGSLFLRAMERGDRIHRAMVSRGWDGTLRSLTDPEKSR